MARGLIDLEIVIGIEGFEDHLFIGYMWLQDLIREDLKYYNFSQKILEKIDKIFKFKKHYFEMEEYDYGYDAGFYDEEDIIRFKPDELLEYLIEITLFLKSNKNRFTDFKVKYEDMEFMESRAIMNDRVWRFESGKQYVLAEKEPTLIENLLFLFFRIKSKKSSELIRCKDKVIAAKDFDGNKIKITFSAISLYDKYMRDLQKIVLLCKKAKSKNKQLKIYLS